MKLYRIARKTYLRDLSGTGAKLYGGRWNSEGLAVVYSASSFSLALLETLAHTALDNIPPDFGYLIIEVPDAVVEASMRTVSMEELPLDWKEAPAPFKLQELGDKWIRSGQTLLMRVPSVIVEIEYNWLINPLHPDFNQVKILEDGPVPLDSRVVRNMRM